VVANPPSRSFALAAELLSAAGRCPGVTHFPTSPYKTRVWGFRQAPSGRLSRRRRRDRAIATGSARCAYKTASGRGKWPNRDPIGEQGGVNLYASFYNNPLSYVDRNGLDNWGNPGGGQNAPPVIIYPPTPTPERTPIRPDNRDRPQRRPERRAQPRDSHGDPNCTRCGPEVSAGLAATMNAVKTRFEALSDDEKSKRCSLGHLFGTWDIVFPSPPAGCGEGACSDTVMVSGKCYDKWKVNYILFGRISSPLRLLADQNGRFGRWSEAHPKAHSLMTIGKTNTPAMFAASCASAITGTVHCLQACLDRPAVLAAASHATKPARMTRNTVRPFRQRGHETQHVVACCRVAGGCPVCGLRKIRQANESDGTSEHDQLGC
jgi:RHS repeat-associated protein